MRKVNRNLVPHPNNLQNLTSQQVGHLTNYKNISGSVYRHQDVIDSLKLLYYEKCYICESDVSSDYEVEHYRPKKEFPSLGYTWENLHKSCGPCNLAKEAKKYKQFDAAGNVTDMLLLDPSDSTYCVDEYIEFNINSLAQLNPAGTNPLIIKKAEQTVLLLNSEDYPYKRSNTVNAFLRSFTNELSKYKERLLDIHLTLSTYIKPQQIDELKKDNEIYRQLRLLDELYLKDSCAYSTSIRKQAYFVMGLNYNDIESLLTKLKETL